MILHLLRRPTLRLILIGILVVTIQTTFCVEMRPFGVIIDLLVGLAVATGLASTPEGGVLAGFVFGTMIDLLLTTPFGLSALAYGLVAFVMGLLKSAITVGQAWWLSMVLVAAGSAAGVAAYATLGTLVGETGWLGSRLVVQILVITVVNAALSPLTVRTQRWAMVVDRDPA